MTNHKAKHRPVAEISKKIKKISARLLSQRLLYTLYFDPDVTEERKASIKVRLEANGKGIPDLLDSYDLGILRGQVQALRWALGADSLDT